jgi:hypothetical protein
MSVRYVARVAARRATRQHYSALPGPIGGTHDALAGGDHRSAFSRELYSRWSEQKALRRTIDGGSNRVRLNLEKTFVPRWRFLGDAGQHRAFSCARALQQSSLSAPAASSKKDAEDGSVGTRVPSEPSTAYAQSDASKKEKPIVNGSVDDKDESLESCLADLERLKKERKERFEKRAPGFVAELKNTIRKGYVSFMDFVLSIGPMLASMMRLLISPGEWKESWISLWGKIKHEAEHYWVGSKLLAADIRIATRLLMQTLRGEHMSRRERSQLVRTTNDIFRLVPFSLFVLIPFMEVFLPFALKLFPKMLPSTFEDKLQAEEELRKRVQVRAPQMTYPQLASGNSIPAIARILIGFSAVSILGLSELNLVRFLFMLNLLCVCLSLRIDLRL